MGYIFLKARLRGDWENSKFESLKEAEQYCGDSPWDFLVTALSIRQTMNFIFAYNPILK